MPWPEITEHWSWNGTWRHVQREWRGPKILKLYKERCMVCACAFKGGGEKLSVGSKVYKEEYPLKFRPFILHVRKMGPGKLLES